MVVINNPNDFQFERFQKSKTKFKKYDAILRNKKTGRIKKVPFGDVRYQHYRDRTPLKLYSGLDHRDTKRKYRYRKRHAKTSDRRFSSSWFAQKYLW